MQKAGKLRRTKKNKSSAVALSYNPLLMRLKQEDCKFEGSLSNLLRQYAEIK